MISMLSDHSVKLSWLKQFKLSFLPPFLSATAAENPIFATGAESWPVLRGIIAKCESDWEQCHGSPLPGESRGFFLGFGDEFCAWMVLVQKSAPWLENFW